MAVLVSAAMVTANGLPMAARAADHGDAPNVAGDQAADLADVYFFRDPGDNSKVVMILTFRGFIVPGEGVNFSVFDHTATYRLTIENTGDARPDAVIDVNFAAKGANAADPQTATVRLPGRRSTFTAPTTVSNLSATAPTPVVTTDPASGVEFFAGAVDDPFFFDIPAFSRFVASVRAGSPDASTFTRGRDTFAGYNILSFALRLPADLVRGGAENNVVGVSASVLRRANSVGRTGVVKGSGKARQFDRIATPAVNVALIPFARKNEYNVATAADDARGRFAPDIIATLQALGASQSAIDTLAGAAVARGDFLRLDLTRPNTGPGGGNNAEAGFPNGRRLGDDVIDTILTIIAGATLGDNVNANDVPLRDQFPYLALPQQPREPGTVDDNTRN